ncbi:MAG: hypothetical protein LCH93_14975 [Proteobacteria bacterium]|nr:hypothetical protein [Pseudomonadota bacterium]
MTMHDGEGHVLTGATAEARDLFERAFELQRRHIGDWLEAFARTAAMVST